MKEYISREAAIKALSHGDGCGHVCKHSIERIPAADVVEVKHGRWEKRNWGFEYDRCSICGYEHRYEGPFHYCPFCGAKMNDIVIQHTESVGNALGALDEVEELSRYIDANKMADELSKVPWYERKDEKQAVRMVKEFPTADVVEVVRCADCKYDERCMFQDFVRENRVEPYDKTVFFCADGKHKDGGQDDVG